MILNFPLVFLLLSFFIAIVDTIQLLFNIGYEFSWASYLNPVDASKIWIKFSYIILISLFLYFLLRLVHQTLGKTKKEILQNDRTIPIQVLYVVSILPVFSGFYILLEALSIGISAHIEGVRSGAISLGGVYYFSAISMHCLALLFLLSKRKKEASLISLLFVFVVLLSGYRSFIVYFLVSLFSYYFFINHKKFRYKHILYVLTLLILAFLYQDARDRNAIESSNVEPPTILDVVNRTAPISHMIIVDKESSMEHYRYIFYNLLLPELAISSKLFSDLVPFPDWNTSVVSEELFTDYRIFRGDDISGSLATGFPLGWINYSYAVGGWLAVITSIVLISLIYASVLYFAKSIYVIFIFAIFSSSVMISVFDSYVEAFVYMHYCLLFLLGVRVLHTFFYLMPLKK